MSETPNFRQERIERLLKELEYEVVRGMLDGDIPEELEFRFYIPVSKAIKDGVVFAQFRTRPIPRYEMHPDYLGPRLKLVNGGKS